MAVSRREQPRRRPASRQACAVQFSCCCLTGSLPGAVGMSRALLAASGPAAGPGARRGGSHRAALDSALPAARAHLRQCCRCAAGGPEQAGPCTALSEHDGHACGVPGWRALGAAAGSRVWATHPPRHLSLRVPDTSHAFDRSCSTPPRPLRACRWACHMLEDALQPPAKRVCAQVSAQSTPQMTAAAASSAASGGAPRACLHCVSCCADTYSSYPAAAAKR